MQKLRHLSRHLLAALSLTLTTACSTTQTRLPAPTATVVTIQLTPEEANEKCREWLGHGSFGGCYRGTEDGTQFTVIWTDLCSLLHELYHVATGPGHEQFPADLKSC